MPTIAVRPFVPTGISITWDPFYIWPKYGTHTILFTASINGLKLSPPPGAQPSRLQNSGLQTAAVEHTFFFATPDRQSKPSDGSYVRARKITEKFTLRNSVFNPSIPVATFLRMSSIFAFSHFGMKIFRSAPEQKTFSAPVRIATSNESSLAKSSQTDHSSALISSSRALRASGRFSVTWPIQFRFS